MKHEFFSHGAGASAQVSLPDTVLGPERRNGAPYPQYGMKLRKGRLGEAGIEPARPYGRGILSPRRLPFRHSPGGFRVPNSLLSTSNSDKFRSPLVVGVKRIASLNTASVHSTTSLIEIPFVPDYRAL